MRIYLLAGGDAAVQNDLELREIIFKLIDPVIVERRDGAVLLGAEAGQPGFSRMDDEGPDPRLRHSLDKGFEIVITVEIVDADPRLHGDGEGGGRLHRRHAGRNRLRLRHQAGPEAAGLHPVGRAADIEVDLPIAITLRDFRTAGERFGIAPAELQGQRLLRRIKAQEPLGVAMDDRPRRHHLRIEQGARGDKAQEIPVMPVRPVHHRRNAYGAVQFGHMFLG